MAWHCIASDQLENSSFSVFSLLIINFKCHGRLICVIVSISHVVPIEELKLMLILFSLLFALTRACIYVWLQKCGGDAHNMHISKMLTFPQH